MSSASFSVRFFLVLIVRLLQYYAKHKTKIDPHMADTVVGALELLLDVLPAFIEANSPGPDPFVQSNIGGGL